MLTQSAADSVEKVTTLSTVSGGEHWFEWLIERHCHAASVSFIGRRGAHITELRVNNYQVKIDHGNTDPKLCTLVTLDQDYMLRPGDKVRIVTRSRAGTKVSAHLKMTWLD